VIFAAVDSGKPVTFASQMIQMAKAIKVKLNIANQSMKLMTLRFKMGKLNAAIIDRLGIMIMAGFSCYLQCGTTDVLASLVVICGGLDDVGGGSGDGLLRGRHDGCFFRRYVPLVCCFIVLVVRVAD